MVRHSAGGGGGGGGGVAVSWATAADALAEISAGVWWIGGTLFWGGLAVLALIGADRAEARAQVTKDHGDDTSKDVVI